MKKIVFILVALMALTQINAQNIIMHEKQDNGNVVIASEFFVARNFTDRVVWMFNANMIASRDPEYDTARIDFIISVSFNTGGSKLNLDENGIMLIKLMDDSVIELPCVFTNVKSDGIKVRSQSYGYTTHISSNTTYSNSAGYSISYNDIQKLKVGVKKIRVQTTDGFIENEYSKDKCGVQLFNSFVKVIKELQKPAYNTKEKMYESF